MPIWPFGRARAPSETRPRGGEAGPPAVAAGGSAGRRAGVEVRPASSTACVGRGEGRGGETRLGPLGTLPPAPGLSWAAVVLGGEAAGEVRFARDGAFGLPPGTAVLLDGVEPGDAAPPPVPRDSLAGAPVPGVAGARLLSVTATRVVLRLGPPPAARWAVVGLRAVAVLSGTLTLVDGEEARVVRAGEVALVAEPSATLQVQAGNDAAVAIAFAAADVAVRLG